jgi:transcriptional regulator with XRE-family HTH domain
VPQSGRKLPELGVLGANVGRERMARGVTLEELAEAVDLNWRTIQKIEAGKINVLVATVLRLPRALGCPWAELMGELTGPWRRVSEMAVRPLIPEGTGTGLRAQHFTPKDFQTFQFEQIEPCIRFNWGHAAPQARSGKPRIHSDHFSVRFTGWVEPRFSERYTFQLVADDGVRLWVNDKLLVDDWVVQGKAGSRRGDIALEAGRRYAIKLEYFEASAKASLVLNWWSDSQPREVVPQSQLYPPTHGATKPMLMK